MTDAGARRRSTARRPLSLIAVHILLSLREDARHGYAIKQQVERVTDGGLRLGPGTLYESLQRLQDAGLIEETTAPAAAAHEGRAAQRRYYRLTPRGHQTLAAEIEQLDRLVSHARTGTLRSPRPS